MPPSVVDPVEISSDQAEQVIELRQQGRGLIGTRRDQGTSALGSLIGIVRSRNGLVRIAVSRIARADEEVFWEAGHAPDWADDWGWKEYGAWASFSVHAADGSRILQRVRWIRPGHFMMGSAKDEEGRYEDEGPGH